jgi:hypothetical protein
MEVIEQVRLHEIGYPVLAFDVFMEERIVLIYQVEGSMKMSVRNYGDSDELFYLDLKSSRINAKVKFLDRGRIVVFEGFQLCLVDLESKKTEVVSENIEDGWVGSLPLFTLAKRQIHSVDLDNNGERRLLFDLGNETGTSPSHGFLESNQSGLWLVADASCLTVLKEGESNNRFDYRFDDEAIEFVCASKSGEYIACILKKERKISILKQKGNSFFKMDFPEMMQCSKALFLSDSFLALGSTVGYVSILQLSTGKIVYSEQLHIGCIRHMSLHNASDLFTTADDGIVSRAKLKM